MHIMHALVARPPSGGKDERSSSCERFGGKDLQVAGDFWRETGFGGKSILGGNNIFFHKVRAMIGRPGRIFKMPKIWRET